MAQDQRARTPAYCDRRNEAIGVPSAEKLTVQFAAELKDARSKVNAADPDYTATDMNQLRGHRSVAQGATVAVRLATLPRGCTDRRLLRREWAVAVVSNLMNADG